MKSIKKLCASILAILLIFGIFPISTLTAVAADTTSINEVIEDNGWIGISNASEFMKIGKDTAYPATGSYYFKNDIDFTDYGGAGTGVYKANHLITTFSGILDGRNFTLKGFELNCTETLGGIFKDLAEHSGATVTNLNVGEKNTPIIATVSNTTLNFGVLASESKNQAYSIVIENVHIYANCTVNAKTHLRAGGFVGYCRDISVTNSSFDGFIKVSGAAANEMNVGGIIGSRPYENTDRNNRSGVFINVSVNADISIKDASSVNDNLGGIVGFCQATSFFDNCTVSGNYSSPDNAGGIAGFVEAHGSGKTMLFTVLDSNINATCQATNTGDVYAAQNTRDATAERIYIRGCKSQNTVTRDIGDFTGDFDPSVNYVWLIDDADDFKNIGKAVTYGDGQSYTYSIMGFYRLKNNIDMNNVPYGNVIGRFSGVFDGNGFAIEKLNLTSSAGNQGFFLGLSHSDSGNADSAVIDLSLGSNSSYVQMTNLAACSGVLGGWAGHATSDFSVTISGVDVYANVTNTYTGADLQFGGFFGISRRVSYYDCNMYGSISSSVNFTGLKHYFGGFFSNNVNASQKTVLYNCNNYADMSVIGSSSVENDIVRVGGFVGNNNNMTVYIASSNFGDISNNCEDSVTDRFAGGFAAVTANTTTYPTRAIDCNNFGAIYSTGFAGGFAGKTAGALALDGFSQFGSVSGTETATKTQTAFGTNVSSFDCRSEKVLNMVTGASVRFSADNSGLRFMAKASDEAINTLKSIYKRMYSDSNEDVSIAYGIIISPDAFIANAGGFTREKLDAYSCAANGFDESKNEKAYIDVATESGKWFNNETGKIAGSITGLPTNLYKTNFGGVAYVDVKLGNTVVYTVYASNAQSRTIYDVAMAALDDTSLEIKTVDGYTYDKQLDVGETYYDNGELKTVADGEVIYSCYSKSNRNILKAIMADGDAAVVAE